MVKASTIYDVVRVSGVSKATVYRVIYNKGPVSDKSRRKVLNAITELNYHPNEFATSLATRTSRVIVCVIPNVEPGAYWDVMRRGLEDGCGQFRKLGVSLKFFTYAHDSSDSFRDACKASLESTPDAMVLSLQYEELSHDFLREVHTRKIPYVLLDNFIQDDNYLAYFGIDFYKSGYLGAYLLSGEGNLNDCLVVRLKRDPKGLSDPTKRRREGFLDFFKEHYPHVMMHTVFIDYADRNAINSELHEFFLKHPEVKHVAMLSSRVHVLASYLSEFGLEGIKVLGFDDIPENISSVSDGHVTYLVTHHLVQQASSCIQVLASYLIRGVSPFVRDNYMHMDILTRFNNDNY